MRRHYLDNLRWATVLLVMLYHVIYMYNGVITVSNDISKTASDFATVITVDDQGAIKG